MEFWGPRKISVKLKKNKARDPHGIANEVLMKDVAGKDLKIGILSMFNEIKEENYFPEFTKIYKGSGSKGRFQKLNVYFL